MTRPRARTLFEVAPKPTGQHTFAHLRQYANGHAHQRRSEGHIPLVSYLEPATQPSQKSVVALKSRQGFDGPSSIPRRAKNLRQYLPKLKNWKPESCEMIGCKETSFNGCAIGLIKKWPWEQYPHGRSISTLSCAKPLTQFWWPWTSIRAVTTRVASRDSEQRRGIGHLRLVDNCHSAQSNLADDWYLCPCDVERAP